jgi:cephalosporin hydroxylase
MTGWWGGWDADDTVRQAMMLGASQDPWELRAALELIRQAGPEVIVEIGCDRGGTLYCWRSVCKQVYGITTHDNSLETGGSGLELETHGAYIHMGDSHDAAALNWLSAMLIGDLLGPPDRVDVLVIDGDHSAAGIWRDLEMYGPLVRAGGLILLHDITSLPQACPPVEMAAVWPDLVARYETSEICNPEGGFGWGVIHTRVGDTFGPPDSHAE